MLEAKNLQNKGSRGLCPDTGRTRMYVNLCNLEQVFVNVYLFCPFIYHYRAQGPENKYALPVKNKEKYGLRTFTS